MYKVLYNNIVIDVLDNIKYAKYLSNCNRTVITNKTCANCIIGSNNKDRYHLKGVPYPDNCDFKTVTIVKIDENEFKELTKKLKDTSIKDETCGVRALRNNKIQEMSTICHNKIVDGFRVVLSDNELHHFKLSIEDQVNLLEIKYLIDKGQKSFIYHETDSLCEEFSLEDMQKIIASAYAHKQKNLMHFNKLKNYINKLSNINEISDITYNMEI